MLQPFGLWHQKFLDFLGNLVAQRDPGNGSKRTKLHWSFSNYFKKPITDSAVTEKCQARIKDAYSLSILSRITLKDNEQLKTVT